MASVRECAAELLELEQVYQNGELSEEQNMRWRELAATIFGDDYAEHSRRSFRLHADVPAKIRVRRGTFPCLLHQLSRIGLSLTGDVFRYITHEDVVELVSVEIDGKDVALNLHCVIAHFYPPSKIGVQFASENSVENRRIFFDRVYYPLYLRHLKHLAHL